MKKVNYYKNNKDFYILSNFEKKDVCVDNPSAMMITSIEMCCRVDETILNISDDKKRNIICNCIYMFIRRYPFYNGNRYWLFVYYEDEEWLTSENIVNTCELMKDYPKTVNEKIDKILDNISLDISVLGESLQSDYSNCYPRAFLPESDSTSIELIKEQIVDAGYFDDDKQTITIKGWERLDSHRANKNSKKIFIASKFKGYEEVINCIKETIISAGYIPICMNDYQTNDYIMPEIFKLIKESIAVVGEVSSENNGVYYELGFAKGLGIDTIVVCKSNGSEDKIPKVHFDIAQISLILYNELKDLKEKLLFRIRSTL